MKLKNIKIENYRFFKEEQEFDFTSKDNIPQNILLYGENGSGKTSLYNALKDFFFYYKNQSESKTKIKENKNIFCEPTDKPKIEITFENDTNIKFSETGFENEDLKEKIEEISKSKLFLTYQDIYNLNKIFRKNVSYEDFKEIMIILFFDKLDKEFEDFEKSLILLEKSIFENKNKLFDDFEYIKKLIFGFKENSYKSDLNNIEKNEDSSIYDKVFYLSDTYISKFETMKTLLEKFLNICSNNKILDISTYEIIEKFDDIKENILKYTLENDRYKTEEHSLGIIIVDKEELEDIQVLDRFLEQIEESCSLANNYIECEVKADLINKFIYDEFNSKLNKINNILSFLEINIELKRVKKRPYIKFDFNFIFNKSIRNIDFDITLSDVELKNHWSNLNEAKLSALNLAIYFSSVLGKKPYIPILVLDDLLISLDMSNRDKILSLLLDRSDDNKFFDDDYQMFIFTHDRAFFEKAKQNFEYKSKKKWKYFEMFVDLEENEKYQIPYIKKNEQNNMSKAEYHFKNKDYPACANYLRKEVENKFDKFLKLDNLDEKIKLAKLKENEHIIVDTAKDLKKLIDVLKQFEQLKDIPQNIQIEKCSLFSKQIIDTIKKVVRYIEEEFHFDEFEDIKLVLKNILHPQSHSDITKPLYKKELEEAIKLMEEFNNILRVQNEAIITRV
ncbi:AAA family ATPase [Aliarcobacter cryaerophilus]|uniref:AAA family ATPase n=1 Tax=Aliarcobacter cryaerophilus TaxID=28198 RepID=UPI003DA2A837